MKKGLRIFSGILAACCMVQAMPQDMKAFAEEGVKATEYEKAVSEATLELEELLSEEQQDTDGDGLSDALEEEIGTNPNLVDTDNDGLSDYDEYVTIGSTYTVPTKADTDEDGVLDGDEDIDEDGLTNKEEIALGTNPCNADTCGDGMSDYEKVQAGLNPLTMDSDLDGASDIFELQIGSNPLVADASIKASLTTEHATFSYEASPAVAESLKLEEVNPEEGKHGYVVYRIVSSIEEASFEGSLTLHSADLVVKNSFVNYYPTGNTKDAIESSLKVEDIDVNAPSFTVEATKTGAYVIFNTENYMVANDFHLDETYYVSENNKEIEATLCPQGKEDSNKDGISDELTQALCQGKILTADGQKVFGEKSYAEIQAYKDADGDGLLNGEEISLAAGVNENGEAYLYVICKSSPIEADSDKDGISDKDDTAPWEIGLAGGVIGSLKLIGRHTDGAIFAEGHSFLVFTSYVDNATVSFKDLFNYYSLTEEGRALVAENPYNLSWTSGFGACTKENKEARAKEADAMWEIAYPLSQKEDENGQMVDVYEDHHVDTEVTLNRGDYISIGNYTLTSYAQCVVDAYTDSDASEMVELLAIKTLWEKLTGEEVTLTYVTAHLAEIMAECAKSSYFQHINKFNGTGNLGGIWLNRELYNQKYQYTQCPNEILEIDVTGDAMDRVTDFLAENSYYNVFNHNCSTVATGAWNIAACYDDATEAINKDNALAMDPRYVDWDKWDQLTASYATFMDTPMCVCYSIRSVDTKNVSNIRRYTNQIVIKGTQLYNSKVQNVVYTPGQENPEVTDKTEENVMNPDVTEQIPNNNHLEQVIEQNREENSTTGNNQATNNQATNNVQNNNAQDSNVQNNIVQNNNGQNNGAQAIGVEVATIDEEETPLVAATIEEEKTPLAAGKEESDSAKEEHSHTLYWLLGAALFLIGAGGGYGAGYAVAKKKFSKEND